MPDPLVDVQPRLLWSFRTVLLHDVSCDRDGDPRLVMGTGGPADLLEVATAGVTLVSAANDFYPHLRVSVFDERPPPAVGWEQTQDAMFLAASGVLKLDTVDPSEGVPIELPRGGNVQVRAYCRGRTLAASLHQANPQAFAYTDGVEEWLVHLWVNR
ncbi:MAG: hypothetical protein ABIO67_08250 [Mycobacteriales bacterium]